MKYLKDRKELARAMNFGKYPVLSIDLADSDEYGLKGCEVRIDAGHFSDGLPFFVDATLRVYRDSQKLKLSAHGACIHSSFGYHDYKEMVDRANAPLIGPNQDVVIAVYDSKKQDAYAAMIVRTGDRVSPHCQMPLAFEDVDMKPYLRLAGIELPEEG